MGKVATEGTLQACLDALGVIAYNTGGYDEITPAELQRVAATGKANLVFRPGDVIYIPWTDNYPSSSVDYQIPFIVADFVEAEDQNGIKHQNAIVLQSMYASKYEIPFDAPEIVQCVAGTTIEEGFYYYEKSGDDYVKLDPQPTAGSTVPSEHTYYKHDLDNAGGAIRYGLNDWKWSAYRQYLNSDAPKNTGWWSAQHPCDVAPSVPYTNYPGFLDGFTSEWKAILKPVKVGTKRNSVYFTGEAVYTYDKFFMPSVSQMYGAQTEAATEGVYWEYWKNATGLPSPSNGSAEAQNNARKIPALNAPAGSAVAVRLRTVLSTIMYNNREFGFIASGYAPVTATRTLPATIIY